MAKSDTIGAVYITSEHCIVMVGFLTAVTNLIGADAVRKAVMDSIPKGTEKLNLQAFNRGYDYGLETLKKRNVLAQEATKN
jgi:2-oxoglutarate ferredoxin oxidoreductase subunit gamma